MSHYSVIVITPDSIVRGGSVDAYVERLMLPYSENTEVPEYEDDCECVWDTHDYGKSQDFDLWYREGHKKPDDIKDKLKEITGVDPNDQPDLAPLYSWIRSDDELFSACNAWLVKQVTEIKKVGVEDCEVCDGTRRRMTTWNKVATWDWYRIGGRWDGSLFGHEQLEEPEDRKEALDHHYSDAVESKERNVAPVKDVVGLPLAIVTPDGDWHQAGKGVWLSTFKEDREFQFEAGRIFGRYENGHSAVIVDCHV